MSQSEAIRASPQRRAHHGAASVDQDGLVEAARRDDDRAGVCRAMSHHENHRARRWLLGLAVTLAVVGIACLGSGGQPDRGELPSAVEPSGDVHDAPAVDPSAASRATEPTEPAPTVRPSEAASPPERPSLDARDLHGFVYPSPGLCLPSDDSAMPNARLPRLLVVHEGLDFYDGDACVPIERGSPVVAMLSGEVVRANVDYEAVDAGQIEELVRRAEATRVIDPYTLDVYRGRQVWIDHGDGVVTRYAHLESIAPEMVVGADVAQGQPIGTAGDSGRAEPTDPSKTGPRIHVEVRVGDSFLGWGLPPEEVRRLYLRLFSADG